MQVLDILVETKRTDEGPVRFLKRTLGKNTAMGKAAQLDVELDREVSDLYKEFVAVSKQDPAQKGMTAKGLANYIVAKGFAGSPSEVMKFINQQPGLGRSVKKGAKAATKTVKKAGSAVATGSKAVAKGAKSAYKGAKNVAGKIKQRLTPEPTNLTPKQMKLDLGDSIIYEADMTLQPAQVKQVLKGFVRKGFQAQLGGRLQKSAYGDADAVANQTAKNKLGKVGVDPEVANAVTLLQKRGYKVTTPKAAKIDSTN